MAARTEQSGVSDNSMAYVSWGKGPKSLILIPGEPGNDVASGFTLRRMLQPLLRPLVDDGSRTWVVTRRRNMPDRHSVADMAADYATLIHEEFDGRADLVLGLSYGGIITLYLAADHPECAAHSAVVAAAHEITERGRHIDYRMALGVSGSTPLLTRTPWSDGSRPCARAASASR